MYWVWMFFFTSYSFMSDFWPYKYSNYLPCVKYFTGAKYLLQSSVHLRICNRIILFAYFFSLMYMSVSCFVQSTNNDLKLWTFCTWSDLHKTGWICIFHWFFFFFKLKWSNKSNVTWINRELFLLWRRCYLIKTNELCKLFFMLYLFVWIIWI